MKATAPEKIYLIRNISTPTSLNTTNDCHEKYLQKWYKGREKEEDIEYTRTDAFIEKVCEWLDDELCCYIKAQVFTIDHKRLNKDLRKHLEDEI